MESELTSHTLRDYLRVIFRQKAVVLTAVFVVSATVWLGLKFQTPVYEAQVKVLISAAKQVESLYYKDLTSGNRGAEVTLTQSEIVKSSPVIERTVLALSLFERPLDYESRYTSVWKKPFVEVNAAAASARVKKLSPDASRNFLIRAAVEHLRRSITVEPIRDTNTFWIKVKDFDPVGAAIMANAVSRSYLMYDLEQQLAETQMKYGDKHSAVIQLKDNIALLAGTLHGQPVPTLDALGTASAKVVEQASVPIHPVGRSKSAVFIISFLTSVFLGVVLAFVFDALDQTIKTPQDIESFLRLPYLGFIPKREQSGLQASSAFAEQIYLLMRDKNLKSVLIAGIEDAEESADVAASLALALPARFGKRVLVIDADMRRSPLAKKLSLAPDFGLAQVLEGKSSYEAAAKKMDEGFVFIAAGKTALNPVTLIDSASMRSLLHSVRDQYDMVFINAGPLSHSRESLILSSLVDGTILAVTEGRSRRQVIQASLQPLKDKQTNLLGVILKNRSFVIPKMIYERV